jgi:uncharacterized membrane protein
VNGGAARAAPVARWAGLLFTGVFAGFLVAVLALELSLRSSDGPVYTQVRQVELDSLDTLAAVTLLPALAATATLAVLAYRAGGRPQWLPLAALALLAGILVLTVVVNLPINADQGGWDVHAPPADWASVRDDWQLAHAARTAAAVLAFTVLISDTTRTARRPSP